MRIGIDARLIEETGVGRYIRNLIRQLGERDKKNEYVVFLRKPFPLPNDRWTSRIAPVHWHTVTEQLVMPKLFWQAKLDLVHIPYHNPPIFYPGKMVMTIHDLTILHFDTGRATTLPLPLYKLKRLGYWMELAFGLRRAAKIITVSKTTKQEIIDHFHIDPGKIVVTYEAADVEKPYGNRMVQEKYILYVGNAYPHKNVERLLEAWKGTIVLASPDDYFSRRLPKRNNAIMMHNVDSKHLANLYTHADALVFPSLMEGFGLPGLEAMAVGTPVVCSDIAVFREIYGDACVMFDPTDPRDILKKIQSVLEDPDLRSALIAKGKKKTALYSWKKMAEQTLTTYERCLGI